MNTINWDDLEGDWEAGLEHATAKRPTEKITFPCESCGGTGKTYKMYGYRNPISYERTCKACKGRGHFTTSKAVRDRNKASAAARKVRKLDAAKDSFETANPGLIEALRPCGEWSEFARSLCEQFDAKGSLSAKQTSAAQSIVAKVAARKAEREAEATARQVTVDLAPIRTMFEAAFANGHKRPKYRAEDLVISRAPDHGRNAGALYIKAGEAYQGKIVDATFHPAREALSDIAERLATIASDPREAAVRYGQRTGSCSCCGRELTNAESVEAGIGPICAQKWGL